MDRFVDRNEELNALAQEYARKEASFVVIYGRRRLGKTTLINQFCHGKKSIYYLATEENENENRVAFKNLVANEMNNNLLSEVNVQSWGTIFKIIADEAKKERIILVIDEFQNLGKANKAFPSIFMKIWDTILSKSNIMLILCGSLINMMTSQVLNYDSPLYGRRTSQIKLKQIPFSYYHEFDESISLDDQIQRYAVTGGVPKYIELFTANKNIYSAISKNILSTNAFLHAEPEFLLRKEVTEIGSYFSLLKTIAAGNHKMSKIAACLEVKQTNLTPYLKNLIDLDIVERIVPITEEIPEKSKMGLYVIKDNFIAFWFKFVYPYMSLIESGQMKYVEENIRKHFVDRHVSFVYEAICREKAWAVLSDKCSFTRLGRWWGKRDNEIDILAYDAEGTDILFGECKYSKNRKGMEVLHTLKEKASLVEWKVQDRKEHYAIFSKSGFTDELVDYSRQHRDEIDLID